MNIQEMTKIIRAAVLNEGIIWQGMTIELDRDSFFQVWLSASSSKWLTDEFDDCLEAGVLKYNGINFVVIEKE